MTVIFYEPEIKSQILIGDQIGLYISVEWCFYW